MTPPYVAAQASVVSMWTKLKSPIVAAVEIAVANPYCHKKVLT